MTDTAWTEADYHAGFRRTVPARLPLLKASLAIAVVAVNACGLLVALRVGGLQAFDVARARGDRPVFAASPVRPTLLAVAGAPAMINPAAALPAASSAVRTSGREAGMRAHELAMAAQGEAPVEPAVYDMAASEVAPATAIPAPVIDESDNGLPDRPVPYLLLADAEPMN